MSLCYYLQIKPLSGPIEGGTRVTIEGSNLGLKEDDVRGKIRIGDIPCELVEYHVSVKIVCLSGASGQIDAPVIIGNTAGYTESTVKYSYKVRPYFLLLFYIQHKRYSDLYSSSTRQPPPPVPSG